MKFSEDNVKALVIVGAVGAGLYVLYRLYAAGTGIATTIGDSLGKVKDTITGAAASVGDAVSVGANTARTSLGGAAPSPVEDQSDAETQRLGRQNGPETGWFGDNILNLYSSSYAKSQVESPDAIFSAPSYDAMGNVTGVQP